jgi:hypothetical protein
MAASPKKESEKEVDKPNRNADDDWIEGIKAWVRRELRLAANGVSEDERKVENP